jgi:hypothetical protein
MALGEFRHERACELIEAQLQVVGMVALLSRAGVQSDDSLSA